MNESVKRFVRLYSHTVVPKTFSWAHGSPEPIGSLSISPTRAPSSACFCNSTPHTIKKTGNKGASIRRDDVVLVGPSSWLVGKLRKDGCKFKANLTYRESSRPAWTI